MSLPPRYYATVAGTCFLIGGCMEAFMIRTGFYERVTAIEAGRLEETREEREAFLAALKAQVEQKTGGPLPPTLSQEKP
ncbi:hypothetical protein ACKKBG_A04150 [Auxenochlorella protothecoides x Auxenochlorella symbiontica]